VDGDALALAEQLDRALGDARVELSRISRYGTE
jgi:hypothetical protein